VYLEFRGVSARPKNVSANGEQTDWRYEETEEMLVLQLAESAGEVTVEVKF
jgi:hypothetical protein